MSTDEFEDDGVVRSRKKPRRVRKDGQLDGRDPPKAHRFKPGQSGNPAGRKAGARGRSTSPQGIDVSSIVLARLTRMIEVKLNGEPATMAKIEVAVDAVLNRVLTKGDYRALELLLALAPKTPPAPDPAELAQRLALSAQLVGLLEESAAQKKGIDPRRERLPEPRGEDDTK